MRARKTPMQQIMTKFYAWKNGQDKTKISIDNPDQTDRSRLQIRVKLTDLWGQPYYRYSMGGGDNNHQK